MIRAVIFDIDGTLLDTEKIYMQGWVEAGALMGYTVTHEALMKTRAVTASVAAGIFRKYCGENFPYDEVRIKRTEIAEEIIANLDPTQILMPDTVAVLSWLRSKGIKIGAATSTAMKYTSAHLAHVGLSNAFDAVICGNMVTRGKPYPDIFLKAAEEIGIAPEECIVVGDTPADVFAGHAAGMPVVLIPDQVPANEETTPISWKILSNLGELPDAICEANNG